MEASNAASVLAFPTDRIVRLAVPETLQQNKIRSRRNYIDMVLQNEISNLAARLSAAGFLLGDETTRSHLAVTLECLRATLYESNGISHPLTPNILSMAVVLESVSTDFGD